MAFDFCNEATGKAELNLAYNCNKASIFFNFGTTGADAREQTYFWDDLKFGERKFVKENELQQLEILQNPV